MTTFMNEIVRADCIEALKQLPDRSIDLVILDPPYWKIANERWDFEWRTKNDYVAWCVQWLDEVERVVKLSGSVYVFGYTRNLIYLYHAFAERKFLFRQEIIIDKGKRALGGRHTSRYKQFPNVTETIWFFVHDAKPFVKSFLKERQKVVGLNSREINQRLGVKANGGGVWSLYTGNNILAQVPTEEMWERLSEVLEFELPYSEIGQVFNIEMGHTNVWTDIDFWSEKRHHPTQKPVHLIERLVAASSNPGMTVLDPFAGSGSTALACINLGRNYIGIDKEEKYVDLARQRIASHATQDTLSLS